MFGLKKKEETTSGVPKPAEHSMEYHIERLGRFGGFTLHRTPLESLQKAPWYCRLDASHGENFTGSLKTEYYPTPQEAISHMVELAKAYLGYAP